MADPKISIDVTANIERLRIASEFLARLKEDMRAESILKATTGPVYIRSESTEEWKAIGPDREAEAEYVDPLELIEEW